MREREVVLRIDPTGGEIAVLSCGEEVVRCRDCTYSELRAGATWCAAWDWWSRHDGFCHRGRRDVDGE